MISKQNFNEKKPETKNIPGYLRYFLLTISRTAAPTTVAETLVSMLTKTSALRDNSRNTVRSRNSRIISSFTTKLLITQRLSAYPPVRFEPRVYHPSDSDRVLAVSRPSASISRSISEVVRFANLNTTLTWVKSFSKAKFAFSHFFISTQGPGYDCL